jgi:GntR family transcriptional regulator, galactonate operon transcriptional repressor
VQGEAATIARPARRGRRAKLYGQVVEQLGLRVVRGDFDATGVLPVEPQLAAELGVSCNLLREAIKVLASKGLLDVGPRSGTRVRPQPDWHLLDPDVLAWLDSSGQRLERSFGLVEFRLIVELAASYLAALRAAPAEWRATMAALEALEACVGYPELVPARDIAFHRSIHAASHNPVLNHLGSLISSLMQIQVLTHDRPAGRLRARPAAAPRARRGDPARCGRGGRGRLAAAGPDALRGPARPARFPAAPAARRGRRPWPGGKLPGDGRSNRGDLTMGHGHCRPRKAERMQRACVLHGAESAGRGLPRRAPTGGPPAAPGAREQATETDSSLGADHLRTTEEGHFSAA